MRLYYKKYIGGKMENIDELIYTARINLAKKFSKEFNINKKDNIEKITELLYNREQILNGNLDIAKKYI